MEENTMKFIVCPEGDVIVADHVLKYEISHIRNTELYRLKAVYANPIAPPPHTRKKKEDADETPPTEVVLPEVHLPRANPDYIEDTPVRGDGSRLPHRA